MQVVREGAQKFERTAQHLSERGLLMREGTIVDATIVAAPSSTKNRDRTRDPEMGSTKKGTAWHFGLKAHVGFALANLYLVRRPLRTA